MLFGLTFKLPASHSRAFVLAVMASHLVLVCSAANAADGMGSVSVDQSGSGAVPAPGRAPSPGKSPTAAQSSTHEQARIYQRANENLITQTVYVENSLETIQAKRNELKGAASLTSADQDEIATMTSRYCRSDDPNITNVQEAVECLDQFREFRANQLRDLRNNLIKNDDAIARLREDLRSPKSKAEASKRAPVIAANIKSQVFPKIPTFQDLSSNHYPDLVKQGVLPPLQRQTDAIEFAKRIMNPPNCDDFLQTTPALADPKNPEAGTFHQIVLDPNGAPKKDAAACAQAQNTFNRMKKLRSNQGNDPKAVASRMMEAQRKTPQGTPQKSLKDAIGDNSDEKPQSCADLQTGPRQDYCYARNFVVMYFNGEAPSQVAAKNSTSAQVAANGSSVASQAKGAGREDYVLKAEKAGKDGKDEIENLYMDPSYIDDVIQKQFPN